MRAPIFGLVALVGLLLMPAAAAGVHAADMRTTAVVAAQEAQPPQINVDIDRDGGEWHLSPIWLTVGAIALVVLIMIIVMAGRGGGTTIVRG